MNPLTHNLVHFFAVFAGMLGGMWAGFLGGAYVAVSLRMH